MALVGRLEAVGPQELVLASACWVADTGRFSEFLNKGAISSQCELEPFPDGEILIGRGSIIDACLWKHGALRETK